MKKNILFILFNLFLLISCAQSLEEKECQIFKKKERIADTIFNQLLTAYANVGKESPTFQLFREERYIAFVKNNVIGLEEKAFDFCKHYFETDKELKAALAILLGHEIIHYFRHHSQFSAFVHPTNLENSRKLAQPFLEAEADYYGIFLAISAGYAAQDILVDMIEALYKSYSLNKDTMEGYPSLKQRQQIAVKADSIANELSLLLKFADCAAILNKFEPAAQVYDKILSQFYSKQICINAGVNAISKALKGQNQFIFPLVLVSDSPLNRNRDADDPKIQLNWLLKAKSYLERAEQMDKYYAPTHLNLACVYFLMAQNEALEKHPKVKATPKTLEADIISSITYASEYAKTENDIKTLAGLRIFEGIRATSKKQYDKAKQAFEQAISIGQSPDIEFIANFNLCKLQDEFCREAKYGLAPEKRIAMKKQKKIALQRTDLNDKFRLETTVYKNATTLDYQAIQNDMVSSRFSITVTHEGYSYSLENFPAIKVGSPWETVITTFGQPIPYDRRLNKDRTDPKKYFRNVRTRLVQKGHFLIYKGMGVIFFFNEKKRLQYWGVYY